MIKKVRKFSLNDALAVSEIIKENDLNIASKFYPPDVISLWINERSSPEYILQKSTERDCFVVEYNKTILGYVNLKENVIKMLYVNIDFHREGVGRLLINKIETTAKNKGYDKLTGKCNINSEQFFKSLGFKSVKAVLKKDKGVSIKKILIEKQIK